MKLVQTALAVAALAASFAVSADVGGSKITTPSGTFLALSGPSACSPCTLGGDVATITGGTTYVADQEFADAQAFPTIFGGNFLAAGPTSGEPAVLTFTAPVDYVSFLWGSPDMYNKIIVNSTGGGSQTFDASASSLNFSVTDGNQSFSQYVEFFGLAGSQITSLEFYNSPSVNAFEVANFSVVAVPEPETYALMLAGLGALGFISRRRKRA